METENYYLRVGGFFLLVLMLTIYFMSQFIFDEPEQRFQRYAIYFDGAVSGLSEGARVTLKGIEVGHVETIRFSENQDDVIEVLVDIEDNAPIREDTVASIRFQGITGSTYVFLENKSPNRPPQPIKKLPGAPYPIIQSDESDLYAALSSAPEVMAKIGDVTEQVNQLLANENIQEFSRILDNINDLIGDDNQKSLSRLLDNVETFFDEPNKQAVESLIRNADAAMIEAKTTMREYKLLAKTLREDPSRILRGSKYKGYELEE